jgi:hypothetical protein
MPVPFNQPSPVLFQLLGWLDTAAKGVVSTSEEKIADASNNMPVGTAQALIEQGAVVFSSIHARLHESQKKMLMILARLNRWYMDDYAKNGVAEELGITKEDFERNTDVIPVSDPNIFAESQRYAQMQTLALRAQANPDLYNRLEVEKRILKQIKIPDINAVLPDKKEVEDMNPALENVSMSLGTAVGAFQQQDHIAHLLSHISYAKDPMYGANPIFVPQFTPLALEHIKQHLTLWYLNQIEGYGSAALGRPLEVFKTEPVMLEAQKLIAAVGQHVHQDAQEKLAPEVMPVVQQMMQLMQQFQPKPPVDPNVQLQVQALQQTAMAETQRKTQYDQADLQLKGQKQAQEAQYDQQKLQLDAVINTENNLTNERIKSAELSADAAQLEHEQLKTVLDAQNRIQHNLGEKHE